MLKYVAIGLGCLLACGAVEAQASDESALKAVLAEPKVKDATITSSRVLYAGVWSDGTRRTGYAMYLCEVLREHHSKAERVRVVDMQTVLAGKGVHNWKVMGEARCK